MLSDAGLQGELRDALLLPLAVQLGQLVLHQLAGPSLPRAPCGNVVMTQGVLGTSSILTAWTGHNYQEPVPQHLGIVDTQMKLDNRENCQHFD